MCKFQQLQALESILKATLIKGLTTALQSIFRVLWQTRMKLSIRLGLLEGIYTNYTPNYAYFIIQVKEDDTGRACSMHGIEKGRTQDSGGKT
jgi:hypothetical protein